MNATYMNSVSGASVRRMKGFTLIEMMIVVAIIGIIAAFAYPQYQNYLTKSRRTDARSLVSQIAAKEEQFFADNRAYTSDLQNLGYANAANQPSENGFYLVTVTTPDPYSFLVTARPTGIQVNDVCQTITIDNAGTKGFTPPTATECW